MRETDEYWDKNDDCNGESKCFQQQVVFIHDPYINQTTKPKTRRRRWTQKDMTNAFNAVKCTGMSLRGAASHYNVPESTLRDRVHGRVSLDCSRPGPPTFFTYDEEKKMVDHILFMSKIGYPYTRNQVVELAGDMTKAVDRIAPFKFLNPSQAWFYAFLNRWPDLKNYLYGPRSNRKSKGVSAESIQAYYDNLEKVLTKYDIKNKPDHIWMTDEVSIACDNSNVPKILPITIQRPQSNSYWNPTAAVLGAGNAAGDKIPAFLMFKANEISEEMMEGSVKGSKFATSTNGWVNADAFIQWYERHFRPLIPQRPVILLYDGHLQFVTVRVLEKAKEDNVLLFPLPPHPPYNHCVESSCFAAYPKYFTKRIQKYHEDFKRNVNKTNVSRIICQAYEWALQPINLIQTFFKLGICPYNNLSTNLAPYMPSSNDEDQNDENLDTMELSQSDYIQNNQNGPDSIALFGAYDNLTTVPMPHSPIIDRPFCSDDNYPVIQHNVISQIANPHADMFYTSQTVHSTTAFGVAGAGTVKVLDNMASKVMNQMHAQRSEVNFTKLRSSTVSVVSDANNQTTKILSIKNSCAPKSSIVLRTTSSQPNLCKISPTSSVSVYPVVGSNVNINAAIKVVPTEGSVLEQSVLISPQANTNCISTNSNTNNPLKVIKTTNNVIIKTASNNSNTTNNRPVIRLQSVQSSDEPASKKVVSSSSVVVSKAAESFVRCLDSTLSIQSVNNGGGHMVKSINSSITTPVVYDNQQNPLEVVNLLEFKPDIIEQESDEINQTCHVCGRVEPPGLSQLPDTEELVVDWAHCDFCYKWVHLQPCCDSRCVQSDNRFKCIVCIKQTDEEISKIIYPSDDSNVNDVNVETSVCIQEDDSCYLLNDTENQPIQFSSQLPSSSDHQQDHKTKRDSSSTTADVL